MDHTIEGWFIQVWNICDVCASGKKKAKNEVDWKVTKKDVKTRNEKRRIGLYLKDVTVQQVALDARTGDIASSPRKYKPALVGDCEGHVQLRKMNETPPK